MSKTTKNILITIVIVVVLFALICLGYHHFKSEPISTNNVSGNILPDPNQGLNNMLNEILDENVETDKKEENNNVENSSNSTEEDNKMTPKEAKAINLAKQKWTEEWGNTNDVVFNVSIQSDGKYLVTVYDTKTTHLIKGYIIDVNTEIIKEK